VVGVVRGFVRAAELGKDFVEEGDAGDDTLCIVLVQGIEYLK
jgi:hypothetical protein